MQHHFLCSVNYYYYAITHLPAAWSMGWSTRNTRCTLIRCFNNAVCCTTHFSTCTHTCTGMVKPVYIHNSMHVHCTIHVHTQSCIILSYEL